MATDSHTPKTRVEQHRRRRPAVRLLVAAAALLTAACFPALASAQTNESRFFETFLTVERDETSPYPPLFGETLSASSLSFVQVSPEECGGATGPTTFTFRASGIALGPYPGTFEVVATYTIGPHAPFGISEDVQYTERFTIYSGVFTITGTKAVATEAPPPFENHRLGAIGQCQRFNTTTGASGRIVFGSGLMRYDATIKGPLGGATESGLSGTNALDERYDELPLTVGRATGGGKTAGEVAFGFVAIGEDERTHGACSVIDPLIGVHVKCLDVTSYVEVGTRATFSGRATVNGVDTTYRIDVDDVAEPGVGDTFKIATESGYVAGGPVTEGNVQVHRQQDT